MSNPHHEHPTADAPAGSDTDDLKVTILAAAEEISSMGWFGRRFAKSLRAVARQLETGQSLEEVAECRSKQQPTSFRGVLQMGLSVDDFPVVLAELTAHQMRLAGLKRDLAFGLVYPGIVLIMVIVISVFFGQTVIPVMVDLVAEHELDDSSLTTLRNQARTVTNSEVGVFCVAALAALGITLRWVGGAARFRWLLGTLPMLGGVIRNLGVVDLAGLLRILLSRRVPLDRALALVGNSAGDPNAADVALQLSEGVGQGQQMSQLLAESTRMPATMVPLIHWGERHNALDQAMEILVDTFSRQVRMQTDWIIAILPPIVYALAGAVLVVIVGRLADSYNGILSIFF